MSRLSDRFPGVVRQMREAQGWSQEHLAESADLNRSYVGEIERGIASPSLLTAEKLAQALGIKLSELVAHCENHEHPPLSSGSHSDGYSMLSCRKRKA
ncbi:MAG TPA: helix-turn-helix transcriptional regulator [Accumulibacter sp.]|jgi:ribosome-binding protein aMBF1 (putative translation factor)|nr:helix-turn-helix transcriptional regulator [Accumulibacter sp.]